MLPAARRVATPRTNSLIPLKTSGIIALSRIHDTNIHLTFIFVFFSQFVTRAASAMRAGLKEPAKSQAMKNEVFSYNAAVWENGVGGKKSLVQDLSKAGR